MKTTRDDTIAAIATPLGEGAISVVRLSGRDAITLADSVFRGNGPLAAAGGYTIHYGFLLSRDGEKLDEVLASLFRAPHSYTGEDCVEFSCHGGVYVTHTVLDALLDAGARQAEPGEFTKRAFLNGRLDLAQAEAVADLIASRSRRARESSLAQLEGKLGQKVGEIRKTLLELCALLEVGLDFSEEGIETVTAEEVRSRIGSARAMLTQLAESYERGRVLREGVSVAIVGKPNVGKSSLFNSLLQERRAIVTHIPGTTRDFLEENIVIEGVLVRVTDTAGLRVTTDPVESEGVRRTREIMRRCDLVIALLDRAAGEKAGEILNEIRSVYTGQKVIIAENKIDLVAGGDWSPKSFVEGGISGLSMGISAKDGRGLGELRSAMASLFSAGEFGGEVSMFVTNKRHWEAIRRAVESLRSAASAAEGGATNEFVAFDVREAVEALSEITGEITTEELLNHIFARFCIGK